MWIFYEREKTSVSCNAGIDRLSCLLVQATCIKTSNFLICEHILSQEKCWSIYFAGA